MLIVEDAEPSSLWARRKAKAAGNNSALQFQLPGSDAAEKQSSDPTMLEVEGEEQPSLWARRRAGGGGNSSVQLQVPELLVPSKTASDDKSESGSLWARRKKNGLHLQVATNPSIEEKLDLSRYNVVGTIGEGAKSFVQRAVRKSDGLQVALKTKMICTEEAERAEYLIKKEFKILNQMSHPNIISVIEFITHPTCTVLVLEYFNGVDLDKRLGSHPDKRFPEDVSRGLTHDLSEAIRYMHSVNIMHRDIKPQNVMITTDLAALRLIDFDAAHCMAESTSLTPAGTPLYAAPELIEGEPSSLASDIWAIGLCLFLMLTGVLPKRRSTFPHHYRPIALDGKKWEDVSSAGKDFLRDCLAFQPDERPLAAQVLDYQWFEGLPGNSRSGKVLHHTS